ncbi:hypothetical protein CRG98_009315 [Punica granatum]|uniref:Uncharacterized protein n=1 Tax=Punica granatum TaxID=22663 RepID=A0A2I0KR43_PUNGR|nr:hypothetical protein CRG98_009315 [Punica granatum]
MGKAVVRKKKLSSKRGQSLTGSYSQGVQRCCAAGQVVEVGSDRSGRYVRLLGSVQPRSGPGTLGRIMMNHGAAPPRPQFPSISIVPPFQPRPTFPTNSLQPPFPFGGMSNESPIGDDVYRPVMPTSSDNDYENADVRHGQGHGDFDHDSE